MLPLCAESVSLAATERLCMYERCSSPHLLVTQVCLMRLGIGRTYAVGDFATSWAIEIHVHGH